MKFRNVHGNLPSCDACNERATKSLQFNDDGDRIYMCHSHFVALKVALDDFASRHLEPVEPSANKKLSNEEVRRIGDVARKYIT